MSIPLIDTHCHYNLDPLYPEWQKFQAESQEQTVVGAVIPGTDVASTLRGARLTRQNAYFRFAVGIHPVTAGEQTESVDDAFLANLYAQAAAIAPPSAIGETGLDYFRLPANPIQRHAHIARQKAALHAHLTLAETHQLPILLHVRDAAESAYQDMLQIIADTKPSIPVVLHCVSGTLSYVKAAVQLGAYISFAGNVTYPSAKTIQEFLPHVPESRILVETDAPYLPPQSHRGEVCHPAYIRETAAYLATKGISEAQLVANARSLFAFWRKIGRIDTTCMIFSPDYLAAIRSKPPGR